MRNLVSLAFLIASGAFAAGCEPSVPANPTFAADVLPIFEAHCVRCHGAGGNLNDEYPTTGPVTSTTTPTPPPFNLGINGFLNQYNDTGTCTVQNGVVSPRPGCKAGAHLMATSGLIAQYLPFPMPPKPAQPLDDWEKDVLNAWLKNPICDTTAHPDTSLCSTM
jgi:hypothetical protein